MASPLDLLPAGATLLPDATPVTAQAPDPMAMLPPGAELLPSATPAPAAVAPAPVGLTPNVPIGNGPVTYGDQPPPAGDPVTQGSWWDRVKAGAAEGEATLEQNLSNVGSTISDAFHQGMASDYPSYVKAPLSVLDAGVKGVGALLGGGVSSLASTVTAQGVAAGVPRDTMTGLTDEAQNFVGWLGTRFPEYAGPVGARAVAKDAQTQLGDAFRGGDEAPPAAGPTHAEILAADPEVAPILRANGIGDGTATPEQQAAAAAQVRAILDRRAARQEALATPEGATAQADVHAAADEAAAQAAATRGQPTVPEDSPEALAAQIQAEASRATPEVIPAGPPSPAGQAYYSNVGEHPDAGTAPGLAAQQAADASVGSAFDLADIQRRKGEAYQADRQAKEDAFAADQHYADLTQRIGEDPAALAERTLGVPRDQFMAMAADARERVTQAAQRLKAAEAPATSPTGPSAVDEMMARSQAIQEGRPYERPLTDQPTVLRTSDTGEPLATGPAESRGAPRQPTQAELDAEGGSRAYSQTAAGGSERPFKASDEPLHTARQNEGFEAAARAKTEEELLRRQKAAEEAAASKSQADREADPEHQRQQSAKDRYTGQKSKGTFSNEAEPGPDKRYPVDEYGYVRSKKGGPIIFKDQKQAARWILQKGHKISPDQIFEIENHPSGQGFTVRERGRQEPPKGKPGGEPPPGGQGGPGEAPKAPKGLSGPKAEAPPAEAPQAAAEPPPEARSQSVPPGPTEPAPTMAQPAAPRPKSLLRFLMERGGLQEESGHLRGAGVSAKTHPGLIRKNGVQLDYAREAAVEAGYIPDGPNSFNDFLDKLAGSSKVFSEADRALADEYHAYDTFDPGAEAAAREEGAHFDAIRQDLESLGEDTTGLPNDALHDRLEERLASIGADNPEQARRIIAGELDATENDLNAGDHGPASSQGDEAPFDYAPRAGDEPAPAAERAAEAENQPGGDARPSPEGTPTTEKLDTADGVKDQYVVPGAERTAEPAPKPKERPAQKPMDEGLFDDGPKQTDIEDAIKATKDPGFGNTLYSNPLDPRLIKHVFGPVLRGILKWGAKEADAWVDEMSHLKDSLKRSSALSPIRGAADLLRTLWYSNDGMLQTMAWRYREGGRKVAGVMVGGKANAAIDKIRKMFFAPPGRTLAASAERTFGEAVQMHYGSSINKLAKILEPLKGMGRANEEAALKQIGAKLRSNNIRAGASLIDTAADAIRTLLKEQLKYLRDAGVEVGEVRNGYLPRVLDKEAIYQNPKGFLDAATKLYRAEGASPKDAAFLAEQWHNRIHDQDLGFNADKNDFVQISGSTGTKFEKSRTFGKRADEMLKDFYLHNPAELIPAYIMRAARRAEWTRRMGAKLETWQELKQQMRDSGVGKDISKVVDAIQSSTGTMGRLHPDASRVVSFLKRLSAYSYLPRATWSSLSEPMNGALRTGNVADSLSNYVNIGRSLIEKITGLPAGQKLKAARDLAEDLGIIRDMGNDMLATQRFGEDSGNSYSQRKINNFFTRTGLNQLTEASRVAMTRLSQVFVRRLAKDVSKGNARSRSAALLLGELGVKDAKGFSEWVLSHDGGMPDGEALANPNGHGETYGTAINRFVNQTIMEPKGAEKPLYANHALGSLFYQLQSFNYSFTKNVLNRLGNSAKTAFTEKDLGPLDRIRLLQPLMAVPQAIAVTLLLDRLRAKVFDDPSKTDEQKKLTPQQELMLAVSRFGLTGSADLPFNLFTQARYKKDPATTLLGPVLGGISEFASAAASLSGDQNSPNTNTAERKFGQLFYNTVIQPTLNSAFAALPGGVGTLTGAAGIFLSSHPATREAAVSSVFGPPNQGGGTGGSRHKQAHNTAGGGKHNTH